MSYLQYKEKNIISKVCNFDLFISDNKSHKNFRIKEWLSALGCALPELSPHIEKFNNNLKNLKEQHFENPYVAGYVLPTHFAEIEEDLVSPVLETIDKFCEFKKDLIALEQDFAYIQESIKIYHDQNKCTIEYLNEYDHRFINKDNDRVLISIRKNIGTYEIPEVLKTISNTKYERLSYITPEILLELEVYNLYDIIDLILRIDKFKEFVQFPIYKDSSIEDFSYARKHEIELPAIKIFFLAVKKENFSNPYKWIIAKYDEEGDIYIQETNDINNATPLRLIDIEKILENYSDENFACCQYGANFEMTTLTDTSLSHEINSTIEKQKLGKSLGNIENFKTNINKI